MAPGSGERARSTPGHSANELVAPIHPKAIVTILNEPDWDRWLTGSYDDIVALQRPYPANQMTMRGPIFPRRT